ncbi:HNH endonuclease [Neoaquamicrobium sediminum]|uniref:HNH endonuclease n=1 Tax=Neoaquamicrobium sediminum TaxID=1849104 RepID=UPI003BAAEBD0
MRKLCLDIIVMPTMPGTFRPAGWRPRQETKREHDQRRGSASERGYGHRWAKASKGHLAAHPLCRGCEAVGRVSAAVLTDHVIPHKGDMNLFWDSSQWQSSCQWHHDVVKQRLELLFVKGEIGQAELWLDSAAAIALTRALDPSI